MELEVPDDSMMAVPHAIAGFIACGDEQLLNQVFSEAGVTIVENFAPYLFDGSDAVMRWKEGMWAHAEHLEELHPKFGDPQDFSVTEDQAFFTLPTSWRGCEFVQLSGQFGGPFWTVLELCCVGFAQKNWDLAGLNGIQRD